LETPGYFVAFFAFAGFVDFAVVAFEAGALKAVTAPNVRAKAVTSGISLFICGSPLDCDDLCRPGVHDSERHMNGTLSYY
jgi:hypothetical protein